MSELAEFKRRQLKFKELRAELAQARRELAKLMGLTFSLDTQTESKEKVPLDDHNEYSDKLKALNDQINTFIQNNKINNPYPIHRLVINVGWLITKDAGLIIDNLKDKGFNATHINNFIIIH